jgi:hypothetical protein
MAKPATLPRWAETAGGVPDANIVAPNAGKMDTGFTVGGDIPTSGGLNWLFNTFLQWVKWLNDSASIATPSVLVARDAAGRARFVDPADAADADTLGARTAAVAAHAALLNTHGAVVAATPDHLVLRDAAGRSKFADPAAADDAATRGFVESLEIPWTALAPNIYWGAGISYCRDRFGIVHLAGVATVANVNASGNPCANLPVGARPGGAGIFMPIVKGVSGPVYSPFSIWLSGATGAISFQPYGGNWVAPAVGDEFCVDGISFFGD